MTARDLQRLRAPSVGTGEQLVTNTTTFLMIADFDELLEEL